MEKANPAQLGAHLLYSSHWAHGWTNHKFRDEWPVRCQT